MRLAKEPIARRAAAAGYTLVELLVYIAIISTLLFAATAFFGVVVDARVKNQSITEVNQQGAQAMELIGQTIRNATSITTPAAGASGASLTLVVPTGSLSPTVFDSSSNVLRITEGAGAATSLTNSKVQVSSLTFRNLTRSGTPGIVQVSFTLARVNANNRNEYSYSKSFQTSVGLRR